MIHADCYRAIAQRLIDANIGIKYIDMWNNQTQFEEDDMDFNRPAVFIEFSVAPVRELTFKVHELVYQIKLHVVSDLNSETAWVEGAPANMQDIALEHFEMIDLITFQLCGYGKEEIGMGQMTWVGMEVAQESTNIIEHIMTWQVRLTTKVAQPKMVVKQPKKTVNVTF